MFQVLDVLSCSNEYDRCMSGLNCTERPTSFGCTIELCQNNTGDLHRIMECLSLWPSLLTHGCIQHKELLIRIGNFMDFAGIKY